MEAIIKMLMDVIVKADEYKIEDDMKQLVRSLIGKLSSDPQGKAALEKVSASFDQSTIAKFLA